MIDEFLENLVALVDKMRLLCNSLRGCIKVNEILELFILSVRRVLVSMSYW